MKYSKNFKTVASKIRALRNKSSQVIIGIDGGGGSGKSTFAKLLQKQIKNSAIVRVDDFYKPEQLRTLVSKKQIINHNFNWHRFRKTVLEAVKNCKPVK